MANDISHEIRRRLFITLILCLSWPFCLNAQEILAPDSSHTALPDTTHVSIIKKSPVAAFWRSMLFPGLGQRYVQQPKKGWLFVGVETTLLVGILYEHERTIHYEDLLNSVPIDEKQTIYDKYTTHFERRSTLIWVNAAFWLINAAEAYVQAHLFGFDVPLDVESRITLLPDQHNPRLIYEITWCWPESP